MTARARRCMPPLLRVALAVGVALAGTGRAEAQAGSGATPPGAIDAQPGRARLERQLRERFARVVQERLRLTDAQMARLRQTNGRFEARRRDLVQQERQVRTALRDEVVADSAANQQHVSELIARAIGIQRQRLDLVEAEQKELAGFLTPLQRARYLNLQEKVRQRVEQLRRDQRAGRGGAGRPLPGRRGLRP